MSERYRQRVVRADGRAVSVVQRRAHLSYCFTGCCCGRTDRGYAAAPAEVYKDEWIRRKLRNVVHLTKAGCLGPCTLANVASLVFDGRSVWFHSVNTPWHVRLIFDYIEAMVRADRFLPTPAELAEYTFNYYDWDARPRPEPGAPAPLCVDRAPDVAILSHADTDLLTLTHARDLLPAELAVMGLPLGSIHTEEQMDAVLDGEVGAARVVVLRIHGTPRSIAGLERLRARASERGQHLALISGTGEVSPELARLGTVPLDVLEAVTTYLQLGGERNLVEGLKYASDRLLLTAFGHEPPLAVPAHGLYMPELEAATLADWDRRADPARPTAALLFYRAHLLSGNTAFVDALVAALDAHGLNVLPLFTSSLRDLENGASAALGWVADRADVLVSTLSFAMGQIRAGEVTPAGESVAILDRLGIPVLQAVASGMPRGAWEVSRRGLTPLDTAINVAIPELDGRIISVPVSFKERGAETGLYVPHAERMDRVAGLAARQARLRRTPAADKRVAFVLTNSSAKASQVGNAVGLDAPASLVNLLRAMIAHGYAVADPPRSSDELMERLLARGTYDDTHPLDPAAALRFARPAYKAAFEALPEAARQRMQEWWGVPTAQGFTLRSAERRVDKKIAPGLLAKMKRLDEEPWSDARHYLFAALELGNAVVALQPPRGYGVDPDAIYHTPDLPPTHHYAAFYRWLAASRDHGGWGADAIVHVGKHGTLE